MGSSAFGIEALPARGGGGTGFAAASGLAEGLDDKLAQSLEDLAAVAFLGSMKIADKMKLAGGGESPAGEGAESLEGGGG